MPPSPAASVDEVVRVVRESDRRVLATTQVADELEVSDPTARKYLREARDEGRLAKETLPGDIAVWYLDERQSHVGEFSDGESDIDRPPSVSDEPVAGPEASHDGGADITSPRPRAMRAAEKFEEEMARIAHEAQAYQEMDLERYFQSFLAASVTTVVLFLLLVIDFTWKLFPPWFFTGISALFILSLMFLGGVAVAATIEYSRAISKAEEESELDRNADYSPESR
jgi:hypothetical protein